MGQVTIYIDDDTERRVKSAAAAAGVSVSRWVATVIRERSRTEWPDSVRGLAGSWSDFPDLESLRAEMGRDVERERI